jgi:hypothetical protein
MFTPIKKGKDKKRKLYKREIALNISRNIETVYQQQVL